MYRTPKRLIAIRPGIDARCLFGGGVWPLLSADVDLVYIRLSALLCAADRVMPRLRPDAAKASTSAKATADETSGRQGYGGQAPRSSGSF